MPTFQVKTAINDVYADVTSVSVSNAAASKGLAAIGSGHDVVLAGSALTKVATGTYQLEFDSPLDDLGFEAWIRVIVGSNHFYIRPVDGRPGGDAAETRLTFEARTTAGVLQSITGAWLSSVDDTYGVRETTDTTTVVPDSTPLVEGATGVYAYQFADPTDAAFNGKYDIAFRASQGGTTYHVEFSWTGIPTATLYSNRSRLESHFGSRNVAKWADLNNEETAVEIQDRITLAIANSTQFIDDYLHGGAYTVPFAIPVPGQIVQIGTLLAGVDLYEARGTIDFDASGTTSQPAHRLHHHKAEALRRLDMLNSNAMRLPTLADSLTPVVQPDTYDRTGDRTYAPRVQTP